ncbi:MAG: circadian clock protein LdpA [Leptolyngbyaceae cyanobacterium]
MSEQTPLPALTPLAALQSGCWFKLICGASYQHIPVIRNLALAYALAGADCIDAAADPAVVRVIREALDTALILKESSSKSALKRPWLMVSINDGDDPHFRKAAFNPDHCPTDCPRPCIATCPTDAIAFDVESTSGIVSDRCYGCGRCIAVCPPQIIEAKSHITSTGKLLPNIVETIDAIEIHTQVGRQQQFSQLIQVLRPYFPRLKLLSVSCPEGKGVVDYLWQLYRALGPLPIPLIWQTDGRPMSGDIGAGTTHATLRYGQQMLADGPPGYVQLAGGTNQQTVPKLLGLQGWPANKDADSSLQPLPKTPGAMSGAVFGGVAYGSYARKLLQPIFTSLNFLEPVADFSLGGDMPLEHCPDLLDQAVQHCRTLIAPLKGWHLKDMHRLPPLSPRQNFA